MTAGVGDMPHDSVTLSREDVLRTLQACINTAKEIIPVFTSAVARNTLLRGRLSGLRFAPLERSNPCHLSALDTYALTELSNCLQKLLHRLDGLIHKDIQKKVQSLYRPLRQRINSQLDDGQLMGRHPESTSDEEETPGEEQSQEKEKAPNSNHQNLEVLDSANGSVIDLDRVAQNEAHILESGELLKLAIDRAWPESAAGIRDLMVAN
ncbi:hypothetical protein CEP54_008959 [Fusarium duplospermum]|uniref:Uncharacterized protein n=1 Tax=Fusarium duplospermum TaxID=1325734 RepID=A0A428PTK9_9HYPO|nr:hypothetical protein CEP54_008959 [Fusarium duplospermum]